MSLISYLTVFAAAVCLFNSTFASASLATSAAHKTWPNQAVAEAQYIVKTAAVLSTNSALKLRAEELVDRIYQQYQVLFPKFMSNKERPSVVVTASESAWDSQAYLPDIGGDRMGILVLTDGLFSARVDDEVKAGIVAHELAHILFWHADVDNKALKPMTIGGKALSKDEKSSVERWFFLAQLAGGFTAPELNGLPFGSGYFQRDLTDLGEYLKLRGSGECGEAAQKTMGLLASKVMDKFSTYQFDLAFSNSDSRKKARRATLELIQKVQACFKTDPGLRERITLDQKYKINGVSVPAKDVFLKILAGKEVEKPSTDIELLVRAGLKAHAEMRALATKYKLSKLRWYSSEDQADEAAAVILMSLGLDARKYGSAASRAVSMSDSDAALCDADLRAEHEPPYGDLSDPHHAPCWRAWHIQSFVLKNKSMQGVE